jgi:hypothetical protein
LLCGTFGSCGVSGLRCCVTFDIRTHDANPLKIGCGEVFSRAQVCAAGLLSLLSIELLFTRALHTLQKCCRPAFENAAQAVNPAVMRGGARNSKLGTAALRRFFKNQAHM